MPSSEIQYNLSQFNKGRNGKDAPDNLVDANYRPTGECAEQINIRTEQNSIENRPGELIIGTSLSSTNQTTGLGKWGNDLVAIHNTTAYLYSGDWYPILTGLTAYQSTSFLEFYDDLYLSNGTDTVKRIIRSQLNGAVLAAATTVTVDDASKFIEIDALEVHADTTRTCFIADGTALTGSTFTFLGVSAGTIIAKVFADSPYTSTLTETTINCNATGGNIVVNLITAVGNSNKVYIIRKTDVSANTVTVDGNAGETIDGDATQVLDTQGDFVLIRSDGTNWVSTSLAFAGVTKLDNCSSVDASDDNSYVITSYAHSDIPKGVALAEYARKFLITNIQSSNAIPTLPWRLYFSVTASSTSAENFYDFASSGSGQEFLADGDEITALLTYRGNLLISKKDGIKYIEGFDDATVPRPIVNDFYKNDGAINQDCLLQVGADVVYFTGKRIKRLFVPSFDGVIQDDLFDRPVLDVLENDIADDQSSACMCFNPAEGLMFLSVMTKNAIKNDLRIVYSTKTGSWWQEQSVFARKYSVVNGVTYYAHSLVGKVIQDNVGYTRDGAGDITKYESRHLKPNRANRLDWRHLYLSGIIAPNTTITVESYIDDVLLTTKTISSSDIYDIDSPSEAVGDEVAGDSMWGGGTPGEEVRDVRRPFEKWISLGRHGRKFHYILKSNGLAQRYKIDNAVAYAVQDLKQFRISSS